VVKAKTLALGVTLACLGLTAVGAYWLGTIDRAIIAHWLTAHGWWAPLLYVLAYVIATFLLLPSTPLNLLGGAVFGVYWGTAWTTIGAMIAAVLCFWFSRTLGRNFVQRRFGQRWQSLDREIAEGGLFYMVAVRFLPLLPYGLVNFGAGVSGVKFHDYLLGTVIGTTPGLLPFVLMGDGLTDLRRGDLWHLTLASTLIAIMVGGATWYRRRRKIR
jgi:uncharacterized membrane protein YdjX (TVP38/TMEM64 family)